MTNICNRHPAPYFEIVILTHIFEIVILSAVKDLLLAHSANQFN